MAEIFNYEFHAGFELVKTAKMFNKQARNIGGKNFFKIQIYEQM